MRVNTSFRTHRYLGVRDEDLIQGIAQTEDGALLKQRTYLAQSLLALNDTRSRFNFQNLLLLVVH
jgi:hypothetical protein